jgi:hypothetical protein
MKVIVLGEYGTRKVGTILYESYRRKWLEEHKLQLDSAKCLAKTKILKSVIS